MNFIRGICSGSRGLPLSLSWLAGVLSTLPNPSWLGPGASDRVQHLALQTLWERVVAERTVRLCSKVPNEASSGTSKSSFGTFEARSAITG
jgi:hypothetical protein